MRLVLVSTPVAPLGDPVAGGVTASVEAMTSALLRFGHSVVVVAPRGSRPPAGATLVECAGELHQPAQRDRAGVRQPPSHRSVHTAMLRAADAVEADAAVHLAYDLAALTTAASAARPSGVLLSMPSLGDAGFDAAVRGLEGRRPGAVATLTTAQRQSFGLPPGEPLGVGLDVDACPFTAAPRPRLVWAARIAAEKRPRDALAVAELTGLPIDVCGAIEEPQIWSEARAAHPAARLRYHGHLPQDLLLGVLADAAVFLQTSGSFEALGITACQAIACGTPVVAYAGGSAGEVVEPDAGVIVAEGDVVAMADAVPAVRALDRGTVRSSARRRFSEEDFGRRLASWLAALVARW